MLWKDETITEPAAAPKIKLIHIVARILMVRRTESFAEFSSGLPFEE
jgi:hypothetical protein